MLIVIMLHKEPTKLNSIMILLKIYLRISFKSNLPLQLMGEPCTIYSFMNVLFIHFLPISFEENFPHPRLLKPSCLLDPKETSDLRDH